MPRRKQTPQSSPPQSTQLAAATSTSRSSASPKSHGGGKTIIHPAAKLEELKFAIYERAILDYAICCRPPAHNTPNRGLYTPEGEKRIIASFLREHLDEADLILERVEELAATSTCRSLASLSNVRCAMALKAPDKNPRPKRGPYKKKGTSND